MAVKARSICWKPTWNASALGLEHLLLSDGCADSAVLAVAEDGESFSLFYRLTWDRTWRLKEAVLRARSHRFDRSLVLRTDGGGRWRDEHDRHLPALDGCSCIDVWPTPFTNTFPIRGERLRVGQRRELRVAWVSAPELTVEPQSQAYTRLDDRTYRFETLDGSGFEAQLSVDADGVVLDYPGLFERVPNGWKGAGEGPLRERPAGCPDGT